jgi:hypothetical protein
VAKKKKCAVDVAADFQRRGMGWHFAAIGGWRAGATSGAQLTILLPEPSDLPRGCCSLQHFKAGRVYQGLLLSLCLPVWR